MYKQLITPRGGGLVQSLKKFLQVIVFKNLSTLETLQVMVVNYLER